MQSRCTIGHKHKDILVETSEKLTTQIPIKPQFPAAVSAKCAEEHKPGLKVQVETQLYSSL